MKPTNKCTESEGMQRIGIERQRQIEEEGWTNSHDTIEHGGGELAAAAACYAVPETLYIMRDVHKVGIEFVNLWPWESYWDKKGEGGRIRDLEKAGALIAAEIDRLLNEGKSEVKPD